MTETKKTYAVKRKPAYYIGQRVRLRSAHEVEGTIIEPEFQVPDGWVAVNVCDRWVAFGPAEEWEAA